MPGDIGDSAQFGLAHRAVLLAETEYALDHLALVLRYAVARVPRRPVVDGAPAVCIVLRDVRRDIICT